MQHAALHLIGQSEPLQFNSTGLHPLRRCAVYSNAQISHACDAAFVEAVSDNAIEARQPVGADFAIQRKALVIRATRTKPLARHVAGDVAKAMTDELTREAKRAPVMAPAA